MVVSDGSEPDHEHAMSSPKNVIRSDAESRVESEERAAETNDHERGNPGLATNSIFFCFLFVKTH